MGLQRRTIQKLLREDFPGANPLVVDPGAREQFSVEIKSRLERCEGVETKDWAFLSEDQKKRIVASIYIATPERQYYAAGNTFQLLLDDSNRLTIKSASVGDTALVSDLNEIDHFIRHCKERLERTRTLEAKRGKVRDLLVQAILAQVKKLAKEERFDFMTETDVQKLRLYVKLSEEHAIELTVPFKRFKEVLPRLRLAIVSLRQLYQSGIRFQIVGRRKLPWRKTWIKHESLEGVVSLEGGGSATRSSANGHPN